MPPILCRPEGESDIYATRAYIEFSSPSVPEEGVLDGIVLSLLAIPDMFRLTVPLYANEAEITQLVGVISGRESLWWAVAGTLLAAMG